MNHVLIFQVLEAFLAPGSELWMFNEVPEKERERKLIDGGLDSSGLEKIKLVHREGNAVVRRHLESLPLETFDSVSCYILSPFPVGLTSKYLKFLYLTPAFIVVFFCLFLSLNPIIDQLITNSKGQILILADESLEDSVVHSDSRSLATLLLIRDIQVSVMLSFSLCKQISLPKSLIIDFLLFSLSYFGSLLACEISAVVPVNLFYLSTMKLKDAGLYYKLSHII